MHEFFVATPSKVVDSYCGQAVHYEFLDAAPYVRWYM